MKTVFLSSISFSAYEYLPYPAGVLMSFCNQNSEFREKFSFIDPEYRSDALEYEEFHTNLKKADFLGLTNWVWNQTYNDKIAKVYKSYRPDGVVLYGGTNVPENQTLATQYAKERPFVDLFFFGPSEIKLRNFFLQFEERGLNSLEGTFTGDNFYPQTDRLQYREAGIPMPYLDGTFDQLIEKADRPLTALFETNRGCPYRCSFCDWGGVTRSKIVRADVEDVKRSISYIMSKDIFSQIEIADANFGIFDEDVEYMEHLVACQKLRTKNIDLVFGGMAKNGGRHSEKIMELMYENFEAYHNRKYVKLSFQSHDRDVLRIAQRSNIKNDKLFAMAKRFQDRGVDVDAEMIIGLPGETREKWLASIQTNMTLQVSHQKSFVLFVVPNTDLASEKYRRKYEIKTKKLLIPHDLYKLNSAVYHETRKQQNLITSSDFSDPSEYQSFEFIYECFSYDSDELMKIYEVWFWFNTLYNAKIARRWMLESKQSASEQFYQFMTLVSEGKMPFFENLLNEFRYAAWNTLIKPEPETIVKDLFLTNFVVKFGFRGNEVFEVFENQELALQELALIYPDINFDHFSKKETLKDKLKLYFIAADVTC